MELNDPKIMSKLPYIVHGVGGVDDRDEQHDLKGKKGLKEEDVNWSQNRIASTIQHPIGMPLARTGACHTAVTRVGWHRAGRWAIKALNK